MFTPKVIETLTYRPIDVCVTELMAGPVDSRASWEPRLAARKFSSLISQSRYAEISKRAREVFLLMEKHQQLCPYIYKYEDGLRLAWWNENKKEVCFTILPGDLYVQVGEDGTYQSTRIRPHNLEKTIIMLSKYLDGKIGLAEGCRGK